jgi:hypothetical protein
MTDLVLTDEEIRQGVVDDRRHKLQQKQDLQSAQGILPFTNEQFFEQSNPISRSALFSVGKMGAQDRARYTEWTKIFSLARDEILYRGPSLTVDHEIVLVRIMMLARGRSLTKPVHAYQADVLRWLELDPDSGANYKKARKILDDLAAAELRISSPPALKRLLAILTSPAISDMPDGKFFQDYIKNRFSDQIKMIADGLQNNQPVSVDMQFLTNQAHNTYTKRMMLNLDPIAAIFFDGVNTTLLPIDIWGEQDRFGKKLLPMIASHRDGVYTMKLEKYHEFSGSNSAYPSVKRRFKSELKKRFQGWEVQGYICPGWNIARNNDGVEMVSGVKLGEVVRIRSKLEAATPNEIMDIIDGSDEAMQERLNGLADQLGAERPELPKTKKTASGS